MTTTKKPEHKPLERDSEEKIREALRTTDVPCLLQECKLASVDDILKARSFVRKRNNRWSVRVYMVAQEHVDRGTNLWVMRFSYCIPFSATHRRIEVHEGRLHFRSLFEIEDDDSALDDRIDFIYNRYETICQANADQFVNLTSLDYIAFGDVKEPTVSIRAGTRKVLTGAE